MRFVKRLFTIILVGVGLVIAWAGYNWAVSVGFINGADTGDVDVTGIAIRYGVALTIIVVTIMLLKAFLRRYSQTHTGRTYWHE